ncbi:LysR family transcriptional regulator [Phenylobacterium sp.]|uniref:LysR family transcriptional regulator n=1 Tax=Phenylobacterium sp. TaxID=1871053 RepID=UPI0030023BCA
MEPTGANLPSMNLRHIEVFHAVYRAGSISAAARALYVSQPSVSKVLKHAEGRLGFPLFRLVKGRLTPTEEAHALFRDVDEIYTKIESLKETTRNLLKGGSAHIGLAVLPSLGLGVAPRAVAQFRKKNPGVTFGLQTLHDEDVLRALYERKADLAVAYDAPRHPRLAHTRIGTGELVVLYRREYLPDAPPRVSLDRFAGHELISLTGSGPVGALYASEVVQGKRSGPEGIVVQTYYVAASLVRHGAGVAIVDEFTARENLGPDLDFRPLEHPVSFGVYCIYLEDRPLSKIAKAFVNTLKADIQDQQQAHNPGL